MQGALLSSCSSANASQGRVLFGFSCQQRVASVVTIANARLLAATACTLAAALVALIALAAAVAACTAKACPSWRRWWLAILCRGGRPVEGGLAAGVGCGTGQGCGHAGLVVGLAHQAREAHDVTEPAQAKETKREEVQHCHARTPEVHVVQTQHAKRHPQRVRQHDVQLRVQRGRQVGRRVGQVAHLWQRRGRRAGCSAHLWRRVTALRLLQLGAVAGGLKVLRAGGGRRRHHDNSHLCRTSAGAVGHQGLRLGRCTTMWRCS